MSVCDYDANVQKVKGENQMVMRSFFRSLTKCEISMKRGGRQHDFRYFVGIQAEPGSDVLTSVMRPRLLNQMSSQKSRRFPEGYEPLEGCHGMAKFCLKTMTIPVPR